MIGFVVALFGAVAPGALAANRIYWTADGIDFANTDGSGFGALNTAPGTVSTPEGMAIDLANNTVYWANYTASTIGYASLSGSGAGGTLNTTGANVQSPFGVAIDPVQGRLYWANAHTTNNAEGISWANLDGSGGGNLNTGTATISTPIGVALDPVARKIYWGNWGANKISFAFLDGSGGGDISTAPVTPSSPEGVAIDPNAQRVYFANQAGGGGSPSISFANLNGIGGSNFPTGTATVNHPSGVAVDPFAGKVYWANQGGGAISVANLDMSGGSDLTIPGYSPSNATFPTLLEVPRGTGVPALSGGTTTPSTLSCTQGTWGSDLNAQQLYDAPQSFAFAWTFNGAPIAGATGSSITASTPGTYACTVTATNAAGSTSQTSSGFAVSAPPPPPPPPPPPGPATPSASMSTSGATATLTVSCAGVAGQACAGGFTFTAHKKVLQGNVIAVTASKHKKGKKPKPKVVAVTLGTGSYTVPAGGTQAVKFTLNGPGRRLLAQFYSLPATVTFSAVAGQPPAARTVRFSYARITAPVAFNFFFNPTFTTVAQLAVSGAPKLGKVTVVCQGGGCPFSTRVFAHKSQVNVAPVFGSAHLSPGTKITIGVTAPNRVGSVSVFTIHAGAAPTEAHLCQPPGTAPQKCAP